MNESRPQKQQKEESFVLFGILMGILGLGALAGLLAVIGLF
jgi:hypothetical protein